MTIRIDGTNTTASPGITGTDTDTGLQFGTDEVSIVTGGEEQVKVDSSGRVGIGATSFNDTREMLRVEAPSSETGTFLTIKSPSTSGTSALFFGDDDFNEGRIQYDHSNNAMRFFTNDGERARILSGGGITFNADTAAANALDDYEEGSFTPVLVNDGSTTYHVQSGTYVKIGKLVHVSVFISIASHDNNATATTGIENMPFQNNSGMTVTAHLVGNDHWDANLDQSNITAWMNNNSSTMAFYKNSGDNLNSISVNDIGNAEISVSATYHHT